MKDHIAALERRISRLERQSSRTLTASEKNWLSRKLEALKNWVLGTRSKNKKSLSNIREAFVEEGVKNPQDISKWIEKAKSPRTLLEKEVKEEIDKRSNFKDRLDYLSDRWENRFERALDKQARIVDPEDLAGAVIVYGLLYAVIKSTPTLGLAVLAFGLVKLLLVGMVLILVFFDLRGWEKLKNLFTSKAKPRDVQKFKRASLIKHTL